MSQLKKYKLKKDLFDVPAGTIFEPQIIHVEGFPRYFPENWKELAGWNRVDHHKASRVSFFEIEVEQNPEWFEEVNE